MKAATLLLLLGFLPLQLVAVTDCPCGSFCETKNECPDPQSHRSPDDCCSKNAPPAGETACFHLEPQSDVDAPSVDAAPSPSFVALDLLPTLVIPVPGATDTVVAGPSPPFRESRLFLLHSALLI